ncbi:MAG: hypothetical protein ACK5MD_02495 [Flavobacteriales bacterium]
MKQVLLGLFIASVGIAKSQEKESILRDNVKIPFTCTAKVDQYMADYQTFVKSSEYIVLYGKENTKQLIHSEYTAFLQKYPDITSEIRKLPPDLQKLVAGFIQAKGIELSDLMKN